MAGTQRVELAHELRIFSLRELDAGRAVGVGLEKGFSAMCSSSRRDEAQTMRCQVHIADSRTPLRRGRGEHDPWRRAGHRFLQAESREACSEDPMAARFGAGHSPAHV